MIKNIFKKNKNSDIIISPAAGKIIPIENVKDEVFSSKMMGDGFAVEPIENEIKIPVSGKISMLYPSLHAFGIETANGVNILVHIGIDTVCLNGKGFQSMIKENQKVNAGETAIIADFDFIKKQGYGITVMVIVTDIGIFDTLTKNLEIPNEVLTLSSNNPI